MLFVYNTNIRCCLFDLRDRQTDRNMYVREKRWPVTSCVHPDWGPNPQFRCGPWLGIEPATFWCTGQRPNNWASWPGCGVCLFFLIYWFQRKRKGGGGVWGEWERERNIYLLFHLLSIHWVIVVCGLTGDQTRNLGTTLACPQLWCIWTAL